MSKMTAEFIPGRTVEWCGWTPRERENLLRVLSERDRQIMSGERERDRFDPKHRLALVLAQKARRERERMAKR